MAKAGADSILAESAVADCARQAFSAVSLCGLCSHDRVWGLSEVPSLDVLEFGVP